MIQTDGRRESSRWGSIASPSALNRRLFKDTPRALARVMARAVCSDVRVCQLKATVSVEDTPAFHSGFRVAHFRAFTVPLNNTFRASRSCTHRDGFRRTG